MSLDKKSVGLQSSEDLFLEVLFSNFLIHVPLYYIFCQPQNSLTSKKHAEKGPLRFLIESDATTASDIPGPPVKRLIKCHPW